ncbi:MAG: hypothetical protein AAGG75_27370 [Bacteroidota bacterium]
MNISPKEIEQIEAYLRQQLSPQEQQALETRMASDPAYRREVELLQQVFAAVNGDYPRRSLEARQALASEIELLEEDAEVQQLVQAFAKAEGSGPIEAPSSTRFPYLGLALMALLLMVVLGMGYYAYSQHSHKAYIQRAYLDTAPIDPKAAGGEQRGEEAQLRLLRAQHLFFDQKHQKALAVLDSIATPMPMADYYRAQIYFQNNQFKTASPLFAQTIKSQELDLIPTLQWHYLLARLGVGENIQEDLTAYIDHPQNITFLKDKARQLQSELEQNSFWTPLGNFVSRWMD